VASPAKKKSSQNGKERSMARGGKGSPVQQEQGV
jgi:hypothetical protein